MKLSTTDLILAPDAPIDLQVHTHFSDGVWTPEDLIGYAASEGFGLIAITDHDRADTAAALQAIALEKNMPVLVAVEMTTAWHGEMTDVLCFGFDPENNELNPLAQDVLRRQQENTRMVFDNLLRKGYALRDEELATISALPSSKQPHELVALLKRHGYGTPEISVGKIITEAGFAFETNDIAVVVDAVHQSGGVCVLAHPGRVDFNTFDAKMLDQLRQEMPIDGVEVHYPVHTPEQVAMYREYAQQHDWLTSSGSDSHGPDKKPIKYEAELSRKLLERLGIRIQ